MDFDEPTEKIRWMNDNDLGQQVKLLSAEKQSDGTYVLVFQTPLLEKIKRTTNTDKPEYAFIRNQAATGNFMFVYRKNKQGYRVPNTD